jgi:hypothetical protein
LLLTWNIVLVQHGIFQDEGRSLLPNYRPHPLLVVPSLLAIKLFGFLWFVETYVKGYILKLLLVKVLMKAVRDIVEGVKFIFTKWRDSVDVVE